MSYQSVTVRSTHLEALQRAANLARDTGRGCYVEGQSGKRLYMVEVDGRVHRLYEV